MHSRSYPSLRRIICTGQRLIAELLPLPAESESDDTPPGPSLVGGRGGGWRVQRPSRCRSAALVLPQDPPSTLGVGRGGLPVPARTDSQQPAASSHSSSHSHAITITIALASSPFVHWAAVRWVPRQPLSAEAPVGPEDRHRQQQLPRLPPRAHGLPPGLFSPWPLRLPQVWSSLPFL